MSSRTAAARKRLQSPNAPPKPPSGSKRPFKLSAFKSASKTRPSENTSGYPSPPLSDAPLPAIAENDFGVHRELGNTNSDPQTFSYPLSPQRRRTYETQNEITTFSGPHPSHYPLVGYPPQNYHTPVANVSEVTISPEVRTRHPAFEDISTASSSAATLLPGARTRHATDEIPTASSSSATLPAQLNALALNGKRIYPSPPSSSASSSFSQLTSPSRYDTLSPTSDLYSESSSDSGSTFSRINSMQFPEPPSTFSAMQSSLRAPPILAGPTTSVVPRSLTPLKTENTADKTTSENPTNPAPFVFPTTRSRAHPKSDTPKLRFKKKKSNDKGKDVLSPSPLSSNPSTPTAFKFDPNRPIPTSPTGRNSDTSSDNSSVRARSQRSVGSDMTPKGFVFPSSRSRAHPNSPPIKFKKRKGKEPGSSPEFSPTSPLEPSSSFQRMSPEDRPQKFMGIPLRNRGRNGNGAWRDVPILEDEIDVFSSSVATDSYFPPERNGPSFQSLSRQLHQGGTSYKAPGHDGSRPNKVPQYAAYPEVDARVGRPLPMPPSNNNIPTPLPVSSNSPARPEPIPEVSDFSYPFDPCDPALLESDKHTHELLRRLISLASVPDLKDLKSLPKSEAAEPSFYNYGHHPPSKVLDLGCGTQGLWVREAAMKWGGFGTVVVGMDLVGPEEGIGLTGNGVKFVQGNFITQPLPFPNDYFDHVRLANLTYAVPYDKWEFVLQEVCRVLMVGGRLELIDDHVFWPYGKSPIIEDREDDVCDDTDEDWKDQLTTSQSLEMLFERLMNDGCGIHLTPSNFLLDMIQNIIGHAREVKTMHLTLALPGSCGENGEQNEDELDMELNSDVLQNSPGLVLWPSTLIPMSPHELQAQALKHVRLLLTCRDTLVREYLAQMGFFDEHDDYHEVGEYEEYAQEVRDALSDYEQFLHRRFSPPIPRGSVNTSDAPTPTTRSQDPSPARTERTVRWKRTSASGMSISSVATDQHSAMLDHMLEMRDQFAWTDTRGAPPASPSLPLSNMPPSPDRTPEKEAPSSSPSRRHRTASVYTTRTNRTAMTTYSTSPPSFSAALGSVRVPSVRYSMRGNSPRRDALPEYSIIEPTLVRSFHVYEGIKLDGSMLAMIRGKSADDKDGT